MNALSPSVHLREASAGDSDFVFGIHRSAFREYVEMEGAWDDGEEIARHLDRFARQRFRVVVADSVDVGYMATALYPVATDRYPRGLYLHQFMVLPAFQSRGIGAICFHTLAGEARKMGLPLHLRVLRVNPRALSFYLATGCAIVGESESHIALELT